MNGEAAELDAQILALLEGSDEATAAGPSQSRAGAAAGVPSMKTVQQLLDPARFGAIAAEAAAMAEKIEESRILSERVSRTVRQLDEAQMNVQQVRRSMTWPCAALSPLPILEPLAAR